MPFVKGQSGHPGGSLTSPQKPFLAALQRAIKQENSVRIRKAAESLLDAAAAGEPWALQMLADRIDGKAVQQMVVDAVVSRKAAEMSDDELASIVAGSTAAGNANSSQD